MKLLLVEDEISLCSALAELLKLDGYAVDAAYDGEAALEFVSVETYDLVILDLNLPKVDGIDVLRKIRQDQPDLRVLILTARGSTGEKILGLDLGANDYMTKPFEISELEARIRALLRRSFTVDPSVITHHGISVDINTKKVTVNGTAVSLTRKEFAILEYFLRNPQKLITQEELIDHIYDRNANVFSNSIRVHLHSLRKKLQAELGWNPIATKIGQGYYLDETSGGA